MHLARHQQQTWFSSGCCRQGLMQPCSPARACARDPKFPAQASQQARLGGSHCRGFRDALAALWCLMQTCASLRARAPMLVMCHSAVARVQGVERAIVAAVADAAVRHNHRRDGRSDRAQLRPCKAMLQT